MNDETSPDSLAYEELQQWVGNTETQADTLRPGPLTALAATLDRENTEFEQGEPVPALWHWLFFLKVAKQSQLSFDGHPEKGEFLPPISLPRRMWAGSRFEFTRPLTVGSEVSKTSTIKNISFKNGRSGQLAFVCVSHEFSDESGIAIREEQDIVYRDHPKLDVAPPQPISVQDSIDYGASIKPDPVFLFRYSALTFNSHRIHYDREYARQMEAYPGLVVHGPLLATLITELIGSQFPKKQLLKFEFKAVNPVFDADKFTVCGQEPNDSGHCELWIQNGRGELCMKASAVLG